ncbi:Unknown protein sequence [Pseudomonas savastanoi pv. phaseolicola]|nr:Unknown protein sequence [Pseudomonas savastanoi pv. phaseolicola]
MQVEAISIAGRYNYRIAGLNLLTAIIIYWNTILFRTDP